MDRVDPDRNIKQEDGDSLAVARVLIAIMPASLRAKCARYPGCPDGKEDWDAFEGQSQRSRRKDPRSSADRETLRRLGF